MRAVPRTCLTQQPSVLVLRAIHQFVAILQPVRGYLDHARSRARGLMRAMGANRAEILRIARRCPLK